MVVIVVVLAVIVVVVVVVVIMVVLMIILVLVLADGVFVILMLGKELLVGVLGRSVAEKILMVDKSVF